jgi:predicted esterase
VYVALGATILAPTDRHGASVETISLPSRAVDSDQSVAVAIPGHAPPRGKRSLLVVLHGKGDSIDPYTENAAFFTALAHLGGKAPVVAFPEGDADSHWHDRELGEWDGLTAEEVIPTVIHRFGIDPGRVAIGGISMGGFGAYDIALQRLGRFCAVGGHSPALWLEGGATAPGASDDAEDFERNDVIATVRDDPGAFGDTPVWSDAGDEDPFLISDVAFEEALEAGGADLTPTPGTARIHFPIGRTLECAPPLLCVCIGELLSLSAIEISAYGVIFLWLVALTPHGPSQLQLRDNACVQNALKPYRLPGLISAMLTMLFIVYAAVDPLEGATTGDTASCSATNPDGILSRVPLRTRERLNYWRVESGPRHGLLPRHTCMLFGRPQPSHPSQPVRYRLIATASYPSLRSYLLWLSFCLAPLAVTALWRLFRSMSRRNP